MRAAEEVVMPVLADSWEVRLVLRSVLRQTLVWLLRGV